MSTRVPGHTLRQEGAPFRKWPDGEFARVGPYSWSTGGVGSGLCSCGAMSDPFDSATKRKKWHREHKAAVAS